MPDTSDVSFASFGIQNLEAGNPGRLACINRENNGGMGGASVKPDIGVYLRLVETAGSVKALKVGDGAGDCSSEHPFARIQADQLGPQFFEAKDDVNHEEN